MNIIKPIILAAALLFLSATSLAALLPPASPVAQDVGVRAEIWTGETITTHGPKRGDSLRAGRLDWPQDVGRQQRGDSDGVVTLTVELRDREQGPDFTSGLLALDSVATSTISHTTSPATDPAGRYCNVTATSASTSVIAVSLRRE